MATNLTAGDIAFLSILTDTPDTFSFIFLKAIDAGTVINFTDNGWLATALETGSFRTGEGVLTYTAPAALTIGSVITYSGDATAAGLGAANTAAGFTYPSGGTTFGLSTGGDSLIAFQGTLNGTTTSVNSINPTVIAAVNINATIFEANATDTNTTALPTGLTVGTNAVAVGFTAIAEFDNSRYNGPTTFTSVDAARTAINTASNWIGSDSNVTNFSGIFNISAPSVPTVNLSVSAEAGTEAGTTAVTVTATASSAVVSAQTVDLGVAGTGINTGDYNLSSNQITIANGSTSGTVTFTVVDDTLAETLETATLTISNPTPGITLGSTVAQNIVISDNDVATLGLTVTNSSFSEGAGANVSVATLTRNTDTSNTLTVSLSIDDTSEASAPTSVSFGVGQSSLNFNIAAIDDNLFDGSQNVVLTASRSGFANGTANLTVNDNEVPTLSVAVVGNSFSEAAGSGAALGTVTRTGSAFDLSTPLQVNVTSSDVSEATVGNPIFPNSGIVTIAAGQASADFVVNAVDDSILDGSQAVMIVAAATGFANSTANLTVTDNDLGFTVNRSSFSEGAGFEAAIGTLTRSDTSNTFTVSLSIDDISEASVPASVSFGFGEDSVGFVIGAVDDSIADGSRPVVITAAADGFANITANLTVTDDEPPTPYVRNDFNNDQKSDILWRNTNSGEVQTYEMNGFNITNDQSLRFLGTEWEIAGTGDFNGDSKADVLSRNNLDGTTYIWLMDGKNIIQESAVRTVSLDWQIAGTGDFNGDSKSDILWRNSNSGETYIHQMNGLAIADDRSVRTVSLDWQIAGTGDFNGDSKSDILWRNSNSGEAYIYQMDGFNISDERSLLTENTNWVIEGVDDFNGDSKSDILMRNTNSGLARIYEIDGFSVANQEILSDPVTTDYTAPYWNIAGTGDYNGDSISDILWRNDDGTIYIWNMDGLSKTNEGSVRIVDNSWQISAPTF
jgi:Calx-beta domain